MSVSFFSAQGLATGAFLLVVGVTVLGALIAVGARNIFHNVLGLAVSLIGVAGIFIYLNSPFVALMEILIYVGAICIAICFAIMLSQPQYLKGPPRSFLKSLGAILGAASVMAFLILLTRKTKWLPAAERSNDWSITTIGHYLLTNYALIFEVISLLLLVAMLGAIVTARDGRGSS
jgi:NADH:ubiquinone oxidoreductase subunit 6 (subunit J)